MNNPFPRWENEAKNNLCFLSVKWGCLQSLPLMLRCYSWLRVNIWQMLFILLTREVLIHMFLESYIIYPMWLFLMDSLLCKFCIPFVLFCLVYEINNEDVDALMKSLHVKSAPVVNDGVVRLRGLPYSCNEKDIVDFFAGAFQLYHVWDLISSSYGFP